MQTPNFVPDTALQNQSCCQEMNSVPINIRNWSEEKTYSQQQHPQAHVMPQPSQIPWKPSDMIWALANKEFLGDGRYGVMHFGANSACTANIHHKRKSDSPLLYPPPKQFISEEKITAHFNELHISSNYSASGKTNLNTEVTGTDITNFTDTDYQLAARELSEKLKNATSIVLNEQVRKLQFAPNDLSSLPESLYKRNQNPCTALIPYIPPFKTLPLSNQTGSAEPDNESHQNESDYMFDNSITDFNNQNDDQMDMEEI